MYNPCAYHLFHCAQNTVVLVADFLHRLKTESRDNVTRTRTIRTPDNHEDRRPDQ